MFNMNKVLKLDKNLYWFEKFSETGFELLNKV